MANQRTTAAAGTRDGVDHHNCTAAECRTFCKYYGRQPDGIVSDYRDKDGVYHVITKRGDVYETYRGKSRDDIMTLVKMYDVINKRMKTVPGTGGVEIRVETADRVPTIEYRDTMEDY